MESFIKDLKKEVQCSLCSDTLVEPKMVSCFHTFCKPCIKRHAELLNEVNVFNCPRCKAQTALAELNSVEDLHSSPLHSRILQGLTLVEREKICSISESHSSASWYCFDCDRSMCDECEKNHSLFTQDHKIVRLFDLKKEDIEFLITRENPCTSHPQHRLELFCEDCDSMLCRACLIQDHRNHETMTLEEFRLIKKSELSRHLETLEQLRSDDKTKQQQEKMADTIKQQGERAKLEVIDKTKKITQMLQESQQELLKKIDERLDQATINLNIIHHIPAIKEYIKNVIERGLAFEMMNGQETRCFQKFIFNHIPLESTEIEFLPNQNLLRQVKTGLGKMWIFAKTDPTKSTVEVNSDTEVFKKEKLTCTTKTSTGELNHNSRDVIDVQIMPEKDVETGKKCVRRDGKVEVEFTAKVTGRLTVEVQVNGNRVSNSPLMVNVRPQQMKTRRKFKVKGVNLGSSWLYGVAVNRDSSRIAVANASSHRVHVFTTDKKLSLTYGSKGSGHGQLSYPYGLAFLNDTDLVIVDNGNHRLCIVNSTTGTLVKTFGDEGNGNGELDEPWGVYVDDNGSIIVCDRGNHRVQVFTRDGAYQYQFGLTSQDKFDPIDVITHDGMFYVSDYDNDVIHVFEKKGNVPTRILSIGGNGDDKLKTPIGLAIENDHHLLVCDSGNNRVKKFTLDGRFVGKTSDIIKNLCYMTVLKDGHLLVCTGGSGVWCVK